MVSAGRFRGGSFQPNTVPRHSARPPGPGGSGSPTENVFDTYQRADWALEQSDALNESLTQQQITPYWLTPIGDTGFYVTPDEPADPTDCDRYPDSPWCGQSGVDPVSLATVSPLSTDLIFTANQDGTEYCLRIDFSLFAIALPPGHICYRTPDARPFQSQPEPEPDFPQPPQFIVPPQWTPVNFPNAESNCLLYDLLYQRWDGSSYITERSGSSGYTYQWAWKPVGYFTHMGRFFYGDNTNYPLAWHMTVFCIDQAGNSAIFPMRFDIYGYNVDDELVYDAKFAEHPPILLDAFPAPAYIQQGLPPCVPLPPRPVIPPPPPHPLEPMSCCNTAEIEEMLRVIMLRLGTAQYPATVPKNLADEETATEKIENLTDLVGWSVRQMDAVTGQFPIDVEIKDADPSKSGDQSRKVRLPNIAEAIAEIYALTLRSGVGSDIHTSLLMRLAAEVIATKNAALITQDYARANASYLGYKGNTVKRKIPYAFNVKKLESLEKILEESEMNIIGWQDDDKNTVQSYLEKLMFAASIIKQVFFRSNGNVKGLVDELGNILGIDEPEERTKGDGEPQSEDDWRAFLQEINSADGGFNRNSPVKPEVIDPMVSGEKSVDTRFTGFDLIPSPSEES